MAVINHAKREINVKLVYFGSPGCGKGDMFRFIHQRIKPSLCGPLKTMPAGSDTLLFFDYIPFETSSLDGYRIRFHLYTLTGPVANPGTWKMTLKGVDGLAFVTADDAVGIVAAHESLRAVRSMLTGYGKDLRSLPRLWLPCGDETGMVASNELEASFDESRRFHCLRTGEGVLQSLANLSQAVLQQLRLEFVSATEPDTSAVTVDTDVSPAFPEEIPLHQPPEMVTMPELKVSLTGNSILRIPLTVQSGSTVKRCTLSLSLQLEEN